MVSRFVLVTLLFVSPTVGQIATERFYETSADGSSQPTMFHAPKSETPVPMVVALHSWSSDYKQRIHGEIEQWCADNGWAYLHPNFRGRNNRPEATGSELAVKDIASAVEWALTQADVDPESIYLVGTSGGGYACLLMAGRYPKLWAGVSAWVPIYDLRAWYQETKAAGSRYAEEIVASCGGYPGESRAIDREYAKRSPYSYLARAKGVNLHISAGIRDGHDGSVPVSHSLRAFNQVAKRKDRLSKADIEYVTANASLPESLEKANPDSSYGDRQPLFRRSSGNATITLFDGDHELVPKAAIAWIKSQHEKKNLK